MLYPNWIVLLFDMNIFPHSVSNYIRWTFISDIGRSMKRKKQEKIKITVRTEKWENVEKLLIQIFEKNKLDFFYKKVCRVIQREKVELLPLKLLVGRAQLFSNWNSIMKIRLMQEKFVSKILRKIRPKYRKWDGRKNTSKAEKKKHLENAM